MAGPYTTYRYDVFLSHSSADKPVVRELAEGLRTAGLRVWFDEWIIKPGDPISVKIEEGLEHSGVLLFCMSANAFGSDWVGLESHTALFRDPLNRDRRFVPLRLDDAPIKAMLRGYAYLDWRPGADPEGGRQREWARLLEACGVVEEGEESGGETSGAAESRAAETAATDSTATESTRAAESTDATSSLPPPPPAQPPSSPASPSPSAVDRAPPSPDHLGAPQRPRTLDLFHPGPVLSVGWSPDGQRLASGGDDGTVRLWEAASGKQLALLEGHKDWVRSVGWSPDGAPWAAGAFGLVLLWRGGGRAVCSAGADPEASRVYTNAKVLVVGESGAGKTGLTRRLATGRFEESEASTIGAWCTQWPLPSPAPRPAPRTSPSGRSGSGISAARPISA